VGVHELYTHPHALTFAFGCFESSLQNFGLVWTGSKFQISNLAMAKVEKVNIAVPCMNNNQ
jgi:hypothetical protein